MNWDQIFVLENAAWPVLLVDAQGVIRTASQGAKAVFGADLATTYLAALWANANSETATQFLAQSAQRPRAGETQVILRVKGGVETSFHVLTAPWARDRQKYLLLQFLPAGVRPSEEAQSPATVSKVHAAEMQAHKQKLDCALQLTRTVALDFNNALTSVLVHTSHVLDQMEANHPWRNSLVEAEKAAEKAAEIANDLAAFSRQEKDARAQQAGNLNNLLRRTIDLFQKQNTAGNITWHADFEKHPFTANFDEAKLQQALIKILENAMQALWIDGGRIDVTCRNLILREPTRDQNISLAPGHYLCVEIKDDGCGIPPEALPRVFEPFFTTKHGHRGLGLAWVYGIISNHGGQVTISSTPGAGTSVRLYLPATRRIVKDAQHSKDELRGTETILMVDDEDLLLTMGQMVLSSFGYRVLTANGGEKALNLLAQEKKPVDLIITDLVMPNMSGRELIEHVRRRSPDTKIIYSSGFVRPSADDEGNYLQKPFTSSQLLHKVRQVLAESD